MNATIHNDENILTLDQVSRLQAAAGKWGFDSQIVVDTSSPSRAVFEAKMKAWVTSPHTVAIGVDPAHHFTITRFGGDTGVPAERWNDVAKSGDVWFKRGQFADGIIAIGERAQMAHVETAASPVFAETQQPARVVTVEHEAHMGTGAKIFFWTLGLALLFGVGVVAYNAWRAKKNREEFERKAEEASREADEARARSREEKEWHEKFKKTVETTPAPSSPVMSQERIRSAPPAPVVPRPAPYRRSYEPPPPAPVAAPAPPVVVVDRGGGGNDMAMGMLIGNAMSRPTEREVVHHHEHEHRYEPPSPPSYRAPSAPTPTYSSPTPSFDSGGSSSSWGGSSDSGGGGSDFGGGGGFDSGGGGSDW